MPDPRAGEVPRAYVVREEGITEEQVKVTPSCIKSPRLSLLTQEFASSALSPHKHLAGGVEFLGQIPKSAAGKILRKDLKAAYISTRA